MREIEERVAAGLRAVKREPDILLFLDDFEDWTWDTPEILGIPVFHTSSLLPPNGLDCLFVPCWNDDYSDAAVEVKRFRDAYTEYA